MILDRIAEATKNRIEKLKAEQPLKELKEIIYNGAGVRSFNNRTAFAFERALRKEAQQGEKQAISFICEVKRASPSKGIIAEDFPYLEIAKEYESAGADAISVLTEPDFFKGSDQYLSEISKEVHIPVLRKDFTVDEYQIYEAKIIGADAVLLICALLNTSTLQRYLAICDELGLSALVEAHTEEELQSAMKAGARIIGVNNRNLKTFEVDLSNSVSLRRLVPKEILFVAESGIKTAQDVATLKEAGVNGVLIGETLMRSPNKREQLKLLNGSELI